MHTELALLLQSNTYTLQLQRALQRFGGQHDWYELRISYTSNLRLYDLRISSAIARATGARIDFKIPDCSSNKGDRCLRYIKHDLVMKVFV